MEKKKRNKILRRIGRVLLVVLLFFVALVLFIRSPWGQNIIVTKATDYVSGKTGTKVEIDRLFLTFSGNLSLEGLYLEDKKGDTLIYSKSLEADVGLSQILFGNTLDVEALEWDGLKANVTRPEGSEDFNFTFLVDAFSSPDSVPPPKPAAEPMEISVGSIHLTDFDIVYDDGFMGIDSKLQLGRLYADANTIDLKAMRLELDDLELSDTEVVYKQAKPFPETQDTTETPLPFLAVDHFTINKVKANYNSVPDSLSADVEIGSFLLEMPQADLAKNDIEVGALELKDSDISLRMARQADQTGQRKDSLAIDSSAGAEFEWPEFVAQVDQVDFENNSIAYATGNNRPEAGKFNPDAIAISGFTLQANDIAYRPKQANLVLEKLAFIEKSGFQLTNFAFDAHLEDDNAAISGLKIRTGNSSVSGDISLQYASVNELIETPEKAKVKVDISDLNLALQDAYFFQPDLANNEYFKKAAKKPVTGTFGANGSLASIKIPHLKVNWGSTTSLVAEGLLNNAMDPEALSFNFNTVRATSARRDVLQFVNEDSLGISVPETILVKASAQGAVDDMTADIRLKTPEGAVQLTGNYSDRQQLAFEGKLKVDSLRLDKILKNEQLGGVSFTIDAQGSGSSMNTLNASLKSDFTQLSYKGYDFSNLVLNGDIVNGKGDIDLDFKDENLNFTSNTQVNLDSLDSNIQLDLNLIGADLQALGITQEDIKAGIKLNADFKGNAQDFTLDALLSEGTAVYENNQYKLGNIDLKAAIDTTRTQASIDSDFVKGELKANAMPGKISTALQSQLKAYFSEGVSDTISDAVQLNLDIGLTTIPILTDVFLKGVERLDTLNLQADFDSATKKLVARLEVPIATYNGSTIDSLKVLVDGTATDLDFSLRLSALQSDPIHMKRTVFQGNLKNEQMQMDFQSFDDQEPLVHLASEMDLKKDTVNLRIVPENLVFNKKRWSIPRDNQISIGNKLLRFRNVVLSRNEQRLSISNDVQGTEGEHVRVSFANFKLQTFLSLLNPDEALASGMVKGNIVEENPFGATGIVADFNIDNLQVMQNPLGNLTLNGESKGKGNYDFDLALKGGGIDLDLTGDYAAAETGANLDLNLDLNKMELATVQGLASGAIKESSGYLSGNVKVSGTTVEPKYQGQFDFHQVAFNASTLNAVFKIDNETLKVDNSGLYLDTFKIVDANDNNFTIDGSISTRRSIDQSRFRP